MSALEIAVRKVKGLSERQAKALLDWLLQQEKLSRAHKSSTRGARRKRKRRQSMRELMAWYDSIRRTTDWEPPGCRQTLFIRSRCELCVGHDLVSEIGKPRPSRDVIAWHDAQYPAHLFVTTITLAEIWQGFHALPSGHPDYTPIKTFAADLPRRYRVLNFDSRAAAIWGRITVQRADPLPLRDSLIAAIALSRGYRVVSRDVRPFERAGCKVFNPWS